MPGTLIVPVALLLAVSTCFAQQTSKPAPETLASATGQLTIEVTNADTGAPIAAWVQVSAPGNDNVGGWYGRRGPKGFPCNAPVSLEAPAGKATVRAWNSLSDEVSAEVNVVAGQSATCQVKLAPRVNMHKLGYFSSESHDHMDGEQEKNLPKYVIPYCGALGIDHLDVCQGWMHLFAKPVSYDEIIKYLAENSTPELNMTFGAESPKLRYGHTWTVNHPGMADPFGDYLKWHDAAYFEATGGRKGGKGPLDLRGALHPKWHPPFVDRLRNNAKGAASVAAHPSSWWHNGPNEAAPATNVVADLAFDMLAAQSYSGIVVMGYEKDHVFYQYIWFNLLNRGYRLAPMGESDGNVANATLCKNALSYTWTGKDTFDLNALAANIRAGHTMVAGKAILLLTADGNLPPGSALKADGQEHTLDVEVFSDPSPDEYVSYLVLYRNGQLAEKVDLRDQKLRHVKHQFKVAPAETTWYVVKCYGKVYPEKDLYFDVMAYADLCLKEKHNEYTKNTGVAIAAPIFFDAPDFKKPEIMISHIRGRLVDAEGKPMARTAVEVWNIDTQLATLVTDADGRFTIDAPATIDVRFETADGGKQQQWLFYEYPPLLDQVEYTYTIAWAKEYPVLDGGQMPWSAFRFDQIRDVLKVVDWTVKAKPAAPTTAAATEPAE